MTSHFFTSSFAFALRYWYTPYTTAIIIIKPPSIPKDISNARDGLLASGPGPVPNYLNI